MLIQIVKGVFVNSDRIKAVVPVSSAMAKQLRETANFSNKMVNLTYGAQARSVIYIDSGHVLILAEKATKVRQKLLKKKGQVRHSS
ncbi:DUF370 domain-containing protein [Pseudothermotoga sp.]|uniref:DUF370 domain-containing protein n=1 Tax=Pseudothermotoga sp. TaxID=2033661 RepID=UPI002994CACD|nr:DUF370 domain-containing protein [Pseudothermotoga sp.]MCX7812185.1 DUF370 domain-containing protein [Pseudothermotoga sp.]MDW8139255.1 DUF370 domain-containing protein [Pseudothermotoga sp.]